MYQRRTGTEQAVGYTVQLSRLKNCLYWGHCVFGYIKLHKCTMMLLCSQRPCLRSDCGTKFIGACRELGLDERMQNYFCDQGCSGEFNPPHASDQEGCWEHMTGFDRRILDSVFLQQDAHLIHQVLYTLSHSYHECTTTHTCVCRPWKTFPSLTCNAHHTVRSQEFHLHQETSQRRTCTQK